MRMTGLNTVQLKLYREHSPPSTPEAVLETDADNAAYRGLSNAAHEVEIGMAGSVCVQQGRFGFRWLAKPTDIAFA